MPRLDGRLVGFARPDTHHLLHSAHKNLPVADLAGTRRLDDGLDRALEHLFRYHDLDLDLRQEVHDIFGAAIEFSVALLATEAFHLRHRQPSDSDFGEGLANFVELERLHYGFDFLHGRAPALTSACQYNKRESIARSGSRHQRLLVWLPVARCDRIAPILAETAVGDPDPDRCLAALVLAAVDHLDNTPHVFGPESALHHFRRAQ